ncbi:SDR family NAD(P)-dependent oxidoreductase [Paenibacillus medicaginis]|uniref:SDR family NAD(P)-dependent oxidoreductase n=1 Tax=Paenibacillus medicaginis TaxID=1470560 RepID=A0ABV5C2Y3_9BACL
MTKSVLLTGCSKGIGHSILRELLEANNYNIYAITQNANDISEEQAKSISLYSCDLTDISRADQIVKQVLQKSQGIDVLINNAGCGKFALVEQLELNDWDRLLKLNLTIPFLLTKRLLPNMKRQNFGRIINITSDADHIGFAEGSLYCASKFGLRGFSDSVRQELRGTNITITTIGPGRVDTYFNDKKPGDRPISLNPDDVANQVMHVLNQSERCEIEQIYLKSTLE